MFCHPEAHRSNRAPRDPQSRRDSQVPSGPRADGGPSGGIMRTPFTGVGTALVTPFTSSGAVDEAGVRRLARRQIDAGVHFLVPCGTTGEAPTLQPEERRLVV